MININELSVVEESECFAEFWNVDNGWEIWEYSTPMIRLSVEFCGPGGPNVSELKQMRAWLPELAQLPPAEAKSRIGNCSVYLVGEFVGQRGRFLLEHGRRLGLNVLAQKYTNVYCIPGHSQGKSMPLIDEDEIVAYVIHKMREAGCPVIPIEED